MKRLLLAPLILGFLSPSSTNASWWSGSPDCSRKKYSTEELSKRSKPGVVTVLTDKGSGSGFVVRHIKNQTLILTNSHVIQGANKINVEWSDGNSDRAVVVLDGDASKTLNDLALLKVEGKEGKVLPIKNDQAIVGADVVAIGAPQGLSFSLTKGVISSLRNEGKIVQTDTAINQGSSDGPLINSSGCVVGVNTLAGRADKGAVNINFAISGKTAQRFIDKYDPDNPPSIYAQTKNLEDISSKLESTLNKKTQELTTNLISKTDLNEVNNKYKKFIQRFPNAKWSINPKQRISNNEILLEVNIQAKRKIGHQEFSLDTNQILKLNIKDEKINSSSIINESSILKSIGSPLTVKLNAPSVVLTGSRYDVDIILENPLGEDFLTGGIILLDRGQLDDKPNPYIELSPLGAGGLFKSIQAPLSPGDQTLAALLVHPKGIISITKTIRVVSNEKEMIM